MKIIELESGQTPLEDLPKHCMTDDGALDSAREIIAAVRQRGDEALMEYSQSFDGVVPKSLRVGDEEIQRAIKQVPRHVIEALQRSAVNIRTSISASCRKAGSPPVRTARFWAAGSRRWTAWASMSRAAAHSTHPQY